MAELLIGSRRPRRQRRMRSLGIAAGLALLAGLVCYLIYQQVVRYAEPSGEMPEGAVSVAPAPHGSGAEWALFWGGECSLSHTGQVDVLRVVGKPHTLGACHGRLLGRAVTDTAAPLAAAILAAIPESGFLGGIRRPSRLRWRLRLLDDGTPPAQLQEIAGLVHGIERGRNGPAPGFDSLLRVQAALDIGAPAGESPGVAYGAVSRSLSFVLTGAGAAPPAPGPATRGPGSRSGAGAASGPPATSPRLLVGRSFSLFGAEDGGERAASAPLVSLVRPEGSIPYASVGWPGLVGAVSGVNAEGIAVLVHPAAAGDVRPTRAARPVSLLGRDLLEHAHTLDEAVRMLEQTPSLGAAGFLVVDGRRRRLAWVERSPSRIRVLRDATPAVWGEFFTTEPFAAERAKDEARLRPSLDRVARAVELVRRAPPGGVEQAVAILRDAARPDGTPLPPGHRGAIDDPEAVHTIVIDPVELVLWVADGPGAGGRFRPFDLRPELRGEPPPSVPAAEVPADGQRDPGVARDVVAARHELRAARLAARRAGDLGDVGRARELCARALVRRPDLPEALLLAGDLARSEGDRDAAQRFYRRVVEVGPDGPRSDEQVRALLGTQTAR